MQSQFGQIGPFRADEQIQSLVADKAAEARRMFRRLIVRSA